MPSTVKTRERFQITVDGKRWLFQENRPQNNVPDNVIKALDSAGVKYETGKEKE